MLDLPEFCVMGLTHVLTHCLNKMIYFEANKKSNDLGCSFLKIKLFRQACDVATLAVMVFLW